MCLWTCVNKGEIVCVWVSAWRESGERMNKGSCKKQICRLPVIHVTDEEHYETEENFSSTGKLPVNTGCQKKEKTRCE